MRRLVDRKSIIPAALLVGTAGICTASATADQFDWEGYAPGSLNGQVDPVTGQAWEMELFGEDGELIVDDTMASPLSGGSKSLRYDYDGIQGPARIGIDLSTPVTSGVVTLQFDVNNGPRQGGNNLFRFNILSRSVDGDGPDDDFSTVGDNETAGSADIVWQPFLQNGGGGQAALNGFYGWDGQGLVGSGTFVECNTCQDAPPACPTDPLDSNIARRQVYCAPHPGNPNFPEGLWYRVRLYFDLDDNGRLLYGTVHDINCGEEILVGERHYTKELVSLTANGSAASLTVASIQLRAGGGAITGGQQFWIDNLVLGSAGGSCPCETDGDDAQVDVFDLLAYLDDWFASSAAADIDGTPGVDVFDLLAFLDCWFPASAGQPCGGGFDVPDPFDAPAPPAPPMRPTVELTATDEFTPANPFFFGFGDSPSMSLVNGTLYTLDSNHGLQSWDTVSQPAVATHVSDALNLAYGNYSNVMVADPAGTTLYAVANHTGDVFPAGWRDISTYPVGGVGGDFTLLVSGDEFGGNTGEHSVSFLNIDGENRLLFAWRGAQEYTNMGLDPNGSNVINRSLNGVGNRWAGATTEAFVDGQTGSAMYYLQQVDENGNRISNHQQEYQAIYLYDSDCPPRSGPISPTRQDLPWETSAFDGGNVNAHNMEYVPQNNQIWVLRGSNSPEIGVYDIDDDTWGIVRIVRNGAPVTMSLADLQLVGDRMYILARGLDAVISVGINDAGVVPVTGPANDQCANAAAATEGFYFFDNLGADTDGPVEEGLCSSFDVGQVFGDVWYLYTASATGNAVIDTCGSGADTKVAVYDAAAGCPTAESAIACNDDSGDCTMGESKVTIPVVAGQQYYIRVGAWGNGVVSGGLNINLQ